MITFYSDNLVDQANIIPSSENALFPVLNLKDPRRTKVFRSTANTCSIVFDLNETSDIDSILIVDNPRLGFGISTVLIEANGTNNWVAPPFSQSMTLNTKHGVGLLGLTTLIQYQFVRITLTSALPYCELANIFIGKKTQTTRGISYGWSFKDDDISIQKTNRYGQKFTDLIGRQKEFTAALQNLTPTDQDKVFDVIDAKGKSHPFFIKIGDSSAMVEVERYTGMVYFKSVPASSNRFYKNYSLPLQLEEAK